MRMLSFFTARSSRFCTKHWKVMLREWPGSVTMKRMGMDCTTSRHSRNVA